MSVRAIMPQSLGLPPGAWRWAALVLVLLAVAAAAFAVTEPAAAGWPGLTLLAGIGAVATCVFFALWPRTILGASEVRRAAEAAARSNIAWVVTNRDGGVVDSNAAYRRLARVADNEVPPPPELALAIDGASSMLYRLSRKAAAGQIHEEVFPAGAGLELLGAVRPLTGGQAAWWFAPRLAGETKADRASAPRTSDVLTTAHFRDAPVGVAIAESDGTLIEANESFASFFGAEGILKDRKLSDLLSPGDRETVATALSHGAAGSLPAMELRAFGDVERLAELHVRPTATGDHRLLYLIDVSEQKALETKFAQSQKMQAVGQLAGGVAHDFNNLLTVIIGNSEFLLMRHPAGDPSFKEINEVHQNALRAATLVGQLLAFSRKQTLQPRVLALRDVVGELALMLRRLLREGVELRLEHASDLWPVHADETQISNAIINLLVNARDAMPKGGTATIVTANETIAEPTPLGSGVMPAGDYVRIEVRDTGTGIAKEHLGKIFDPFFTTKPVGQGTGLGLATVYGIIKQTGGFVSVDSEIGKGTIFRIHLPRYRGENPPLAETERIAAPRDITGQDTILLVEDEEAVRSFAARALKLRGYHVLEAAGGEEALELVKLHAGAIHLLITDVVMPNMDGPTLVRAVKRLRPDMAVIFMSGYAEEAFRRHDENAAELHFLPKPFGLKQLAAKVKDVLSSAPEPKRLS
ncbi:MAG TPA: ATP-binding protein [Rhizomicrobium sp.]|jgi:two-component system cell cycle sensor histidine kinase/response regulator CckA